MDGGRARSESAQTGARNGGGARLTLVSGVGGKLPACFLVEADGVRLLLDLGEGPQPGLRPDIGRIGKPVNAILLSHAHEDHANALDLRRQLGMPPVYATAETWSLLPESLVPSEDRRLLSGRGISTVAGVTVRTGSAGHAPGSVWLHLAIGSGLLYTGDFTVESLLYPFDPPPSAATLIADASYGDHDESLESQIDAVAAMVGGGGVLPVPDGGRGPEMACRLVERGLPVPYLCPQLRAQAEMIMSGEDRSVGPAGRSLVAGLFERGLPAQRGRDTIVICADANCTSGLSAEILAERGADARFVFTGHVPPGTPAADLLARGQARWSRWNVHPRRRDLLRLIEETGARQVAFAFVERERVQSAADAILPVEAIWSGTVQL
jgi:glyoxylase-like metal-dependent hydrolase (beta-lactamase superfamily II)